MRRLMALLLLATTASPSPTAAATVLSSSLRDRDRNRVIDALDASLPVDGTVPVIVTMTHHVDPAVFGIAAIAKWHVIPAFAARLTTPQVHALARRNDVLQIEPDFTLTARMSTARRYEGVDKAVTDFNVSGDRTGNRKVFTRDDIVACIVDTGVDAAHVDLDQGQVIAWHDFVNGRTTPYDDNGHGSHVAGILAGQGDGNWADRGVAFGSALAVAKALDSRGAGSATTIISAIDWCVSNRAAFNIRIMNLSLGSSTASDGTDAISRAVNAASDAGILPVVAAGNSGPASGTIGSPAAASKALTVCSVADPGELGFSVSPFSSRGPTLDGRVKPDVCAPGMNITSVKAGSTNGYVTLSGTSMASPFAAGVAALLLDANPALTPAQLKSTLMNTAEDWVSSGADNETGAGRLRAYDAARTVLGATGIGPLTPKHFAVAGTISAAKSRQTWKLPVTSTSYPLAATLIVPGTTSTRDFDLYIYKPDGSLAASSTSTARQDTAACALSVTGSYTAVVVSYAGTGSYWLDLSYGGTTPSRI